MQGHTTLPYFCFEMLILRKYRSKCSYTASVTELAADF